MKDYYTIKEVILGLRREQSRIAKELKELEKCLNNYLNKRYNNSRFFVTQTMTDEMSKMIYALQVNFDSIEKLKHLLTGKISLFHDLTIYHNVKKDDDGNYQIINNEDIKINENNQEKFNNLVNSLLNDEFINNGYSYVKFENNEVFFDLFLKSTTTSSFENINFSKSSNHMFYDASKDIISFNFIKILKSSEDVINDFLKIKIPRKNFSEYIQSVIDNNDDHKKDIIVPNNKIITRKSDFYLNEERNAFVLVKK